MIYCMEKELLLLEFIPEKLRRSFRLESYTKKEKEWTLNLKEEKVCVPKELAGKEVILNGYMNPVEIIDFPFQGKLVYLKFYRRRWREKGRQESYHNSYEFHRPGMKTTDAFGDFLKGLNREEFDEFCSVWSGVRDFWEEDIRVVQKCLEWFHRTRNTTEAP